ncbi:MAG: hypothetical protein R3C11_27410 [Planctomycetaceae bacterium]
MLVSLPTLPQLPSALRNQLELTYLKYATEILPLSYTEFIRNEFHIDLTTQYAGLPIQSPFGKASGQLSMTSRQVADDVSAGLGFIVLKTVIAQDESGAQTMQDWVSTETKMVVEPIVGAEGDTGWTVTWKGRGWSRSFNDYLNLIREANQISGDQCLIVPSCKYHLPGPHQQLWNEDEYRFTTKALYEAWNSSRVGEKKSMPLEKDFSPTLAGDRLSEVREQILNWLNEVPRLIRASLTNPDQIRIGLKLFNTLFEDEFQLELLNQIHKGEHHPDFFIYGNRLFDPRREFEGHLGVAYGGPDLSDRNLRILTRYRQLNTAQNILPLSATGNINSGRRAVEYMLCGAENFQMHTYFQLPASEYSCKVGNKTHKALHELYFHPEQGLIAWLVHLAQLLDMPDKQISFSKLVQEIKSRNATLDH